MIEKVGKSHDNEITEKSGKRHDSFLNASLFLRAVPKSRPLPLTGSGVLQTQKLRSSLNAEGPELSQFLSSKPGIGQTVARHALTTARSLSVSDVFFPDPLQFTPSKSSLTLSLVRW